MTIRVMASRTGTAHVVTTKREYKGKVYCTHLLRRSYREDGKVKNETLGNLSHLPDSVIDLIRRSLAGETFVPAGYQLREKSGWQKAVVALANKNARILWAVFARGKPFDAHHVSVKPSMAGPAM